MTNRLAAGLIALLVVLGAPLPRTASAARDSAGVTIAYVQLEGDPAYEPHRAYTGLSLRDRFRPIDGARTALKESGILARALGIPFELREIVVAPGDDPVSAIGAAEDAGVHVFLLDLPLAETEAAAGAFAADPSIMLFNIRHGDDALRGEACAPELFHTIPSRAMLSDALAQFLRSRDWTELLLLSGTSPEDRAQADAFRSSAGKFGLDIRADRDFLLGNDPREREQNNVALLTGDARYDAIVLVDTDGEFGRYVPFATYLPRPVVGSEGLTASAWHWTWERNGAPQLNQRFDRIAARRMNATDWAAWAAVRTVVEAVQRTRSTDPAAIRATLHEPGFSLDLYKGLPGSYRAWDNQLRQPILLHTSNAVIAWAPVEGFLHERNVLDSLGGDEPESRCRM